MTLYGFQSTVKGVFDTNSYHAINGSLWTIQYEFSLYVLIALLFYFRENKKFISVLLTVVMVLLYVVYNFFIERVAGMQLLHLQGYHFFNLGTFFVMGSLLASIQL
jgi:peptidoglycan/LPS O-acetylase OafA/YrhL